MGISIGTLRDRVLRLLGDPESSGYSSDLINDSICAALDAITPWIPKRSTIDITGDGTNNVFELPDDLNSIQTVMIKSSGEIISNALFTPGTYFGENISATNDWIEYPSGYISFSKTLNSSEVYTLYYIAVWGKSEESWGATAQVEAPSYATVGLTLYAASYALLPAATSLSEIRQFSTKVDLGTPESNPMQKASDHLLRLFFAEMGRMPKQQKAQR